MENPAQRGFHCSLAARVAVGLLQTSVVERCKKLARLFSYTINGVKTEEGRIVLACETFWVFQHVPERLATIFIRQYMAFDDAVHPEPFGLAYVKRERAD